MPGLGPESHPRCMETFSFEALSLHCYHKNLWEEQLPFKRLSCKGYLAEKEVRQEKWLCSPAKLLSASLQVLDHEVLRHLRAQSSCTAVTVCHCLHTQAVTVGLLFVTKFPLNPIQTGYYCCAVRCLV